MILWSQFRVSLQIMPPFSILKKYLPCGLVHPNFKYSHKIECLSELPIIANRFSEAMNKPSEG